MVGFKIFQQFKVPKNKTIKTRFLSGVSLIEVIVSVAIFSVIIISSTQIFALVIDGQRNAIATQNVQESLKYFLEVIGKEIRMARIDKGLCDEIPDDKIYYRTMSPYGSTLSFRSYYDECVTYYLEPDPTDSAIKRFKIVRITNGVKLMGFISPKKITMDALKFFVSDANQNQAAVTISLKAHAVNSAQFVSEMNVQTTLTSRFYKSF